MTLVEFKFPKSVLKLPHCSPNMRYCYISNQCIISLLFLPSQCSAGVESPDSGVENTHHVSVTDQDSFDDLDDIIGSCVALYAFEGKLISSLMFNIS